MKKHPKFFLVISQLIAVCALASDIREIRIGERFTSPDGRFVAQITDEDERGRNVQIKDQNTGESYKAATSLPLFSFEWTTDSNTVVLLEHIGGGTQIRLLHFNGSV